MDGDIFIICIYVIIVLSAICAFALIVDIIKSIAYRNRQIKTDVSRLQSRVRR